MTTVTVESSWIPAMSEGRRPNELAGRQGFEFGETCFSKLVMARDFWF
jgi:hypothetical protein